MKELPSAYDPKQVEDKIYQLWEESGYFNPDNLPLKKTAQSYTIVIPPPNVTGSLHMGHALNGAIQDILIRQKRMQQFRVLWLPGTDHAGIATQNVVEKKLRKEGKTRHDLGRETFLREVWAWKEQYGNTIIDQFKKLGCSCDWSRQRFTMDSDYTKAIEFAFTHYYDRGLIYKGKRVINWCPRCQTSLSDLEVGYLEQQAKFYYFRYDNDFPITIATTRPETKLGDTAVAVNPNDQRYKKYIGQVFEVNFADLKRKIKIIADRAIDEDFGTGALGVTPAHSIIDFELAQKNNLPIIEVIDKYGRMTTEAGENYQGLKAKEAAEKLIEHLRSNDLMEKEEAITNNLSVCDRCQTPIEPIPSEQWFLKMQDLVKPAIEMVRRGKIKFVPIRWKKPYLNWMKNVHDWCISRQIWWGHKIPIEGEADVLDTWFSSALWPFATLGWPQKNKDLKTFFPTNTLSTARDILYLWVARMIFSSMEFTKQIPFSTVYIHPTVFNKEGKRMSKSLGTGIDPVDLIEKYGADATRFGLIYQTLENQDIKFSEDTLVTGRKFCNKLWNAARFVMSRKSKVSLSPRLWRVSESRKSKPQFQNKKLTVADRKILKKLEKVIKNVNKDLVNLRFGQPLHLLYDFFWHDFCDQYIEAAKNQLSNPQFKENTEEILMYVLTSTLKLLHPFIPFITEEIWQILPIKDKKILMVTAWPH